MARPKRSQKGTAPVDAKQKADFIKEKKVPKMTEGEKHKFKSSASMVDQQQCSETPRANEQTADKEKTKKKTTITGKKRKHSPNEQEFGAGSSKNKKQQTNSTVVSSKKTPLKITSPGRKQERYPMRATLRNDSHIQQSIVTLAGPSNKVGEHEVDSKTHSRKNQTKKGFTNDHIQAEALTVDANCGYDESLNNKMQEKVSAAGEKETKVPKTNANGSVKARKGKNIEMVGLKVKKERKPERDQEQEEPKMKTETESGSSSSKAQPKKLVGAHCSIAGGLHNAVKEASAMGARAFGLFLKSQRCWASKPLDLEAAEKFKASCKEYGFPPNSILPHGSYLMNCGSPNPDTLRKSRESLLDELQRCEALGLTLFNFHPGSTCGELSAAECMDQIGKAINWAHQQTKFVITVIENMSCQGNTIGGRFEELKGIIDRVKDKSRIGVCLDTCHAFAAGFDLSSSKGFDKFVSDFDSIVGFQYLKAMHLNDSKGGVGCHLDRHENIGKGQIGLEGFRRVMAEPRFDGVPMILETPVGDYAKEIRLLNKMIL